MSRWAWLLVALLAGGCAAKHPPTVDTSHHYLLLRDDLPSDTLVCAPLELATEEWSYRCLPIGDVRWYLRSQRKGLTK